MSLNDSDIYKILDCCYWVNTDYGYSSYYNILIDEYNYNPKSLLLYIDSLATYEALDGGCCVIKGDMGVNLVNLKCMFIE